MSARVLTRSQIAARIADKHCIGSNRTTDNATEPRWTFDLAGIEAMLANCVAPTHEADQRGGA